jgi:hypothetical protein
MVLDRHQNRFHGEVPTELKQMKAMWTGSPAGLSSRMNAGGA